MRQRSGRSGRPCSITTRSRPGARPRSTRPSRPARCSRAVGQEPADNVARVNVDDHVAVEVRPLRGAASLVMSHDQTRFARRTYPVLGLAVPAEVGGSLPLLGRRSHRNRYRGESSLHLDHRPRPASSACKRSSPWRSRAVSRSRGLPGGRPTDLARASRAPRLVLPPVALIPHPAPGLGRQAVDGRKSRYRTVGGRRSRVRSERWVLSPAMGPKSYVRRTGRSDNLFVVAIHHFGGLHTRERSRSWVVHPPLVHRQT